MLQHSYITVCGCVKCLIPLPRLHTHDHSSKEKPATDRACVKVCVCLCVCRWCAVTMSYISFMITLSERAPVGAWESVQNSLIIKCAWIHTVILYVSMQMSGSKNTGMNIHALLCAVLEQMWTLTCFYFPRFCPNLHLHRVVFQKTSVLWCIAEQYDAFYDITYVSLH